MFNTGEPSFIKQAVNKARQLIEEKRDTGDVYNILQSIDRSLRLLSGQPISITEQLQTIVTGTTITTTETTLGNIPSKVEYIIRIWQIYAACGAGTSARIQIIDNVIGVPRYFFADYEEPCLKDLQNPIKFNEGESVSIKGVVDDKIGGTSNTLYVYISYDYERIQKVGI